MSVLSAATLITDLGYSADPQLQAYVQDIVAYAQLKMARHGLIFYDVEPEETTKDFSSDISVVDIGFALSISQVAKKTKFSSGFEVLTQWDDFLLNRYDSDPELTTHPISSVELRTPLRSNQVLQVTGVFAFGKKDEFPADLKIALKSTIQQFAEYFITKKKKAANGGQTASQVKVGKIDIKNTSQKDDVTSLYDGIDPGDFQAMFTRNHKFDQAIMNYVPVI